MLSKRVIQLLTIPLALILLSTSSLCADARRHNSKNSSGKTYMSIKLPSTHPLTVTRTKRAGKVGKRQRKARAAAHRVQQEVGVLVMSESGEIVLDKLSETEFNPASVSKIVTAYGALKTFGLGYQFATNVLTDGSFDKATGTLNGNIYLKGNDPDFEHFDAVALGKTISDSGIKRVTGKLVVSKSFSYGSCSDPGWSARALHRIWARGSSGHIIIRKGTATGEAPEAATVAVQYNSECFKDTLKEMLCYSENGVAEQIGRVSGGVRRLEQIVCAESGLKPGAIKLATASGLGKGRIKPKDMMVVLKALRNELKYNGIDFQDIFPVAGIDPGTLDERFTDPVERGSVVGKTGSLPGTDGGTSTLVGMFRAQQEDFYFVIFCWKGNVVSFRRQQDDLIRQVQAGRGGPKPFSYRTLEHDGA